MALSREDVEEVERWLKSAAFPRVFDQIETKYTAAWKAARSTDDREYCWRMIQCLHQVAAEIEAIVGNQKIDLHNARRSQFSWNLPPVELGEQALKE